MVAAALPALSGTSGAAATTVQGESMARPAHGASILHERSAVGGRALRLLSNGTATKRMTTSFTVASVVVRARGQMFQGAPIMAVSVNGGRARRVTVSRSTYANYAVPVYAAAGTISVAVSFVNDYRRPGHGDRNLIVDQVTVRSAAAARAAQALPRGQGGSWRLTFDDEFNGTSLDLSKWSPNWYGEGGTMNDVHTYQANVREAGGNLILTLASSSSGALVHTDYGAGRYQLPVGSFAEARVSFPGNGTQIYNWPAWWVSGPNWPAAGEHDVAEGLGTLTANYHSPSGAHNGMVSGTWSNAFHTYGVYRGRGYADVYWDGRLVRHYSTDDNGQPEELIFNVGAGNTAAYGAASQMRVDYVRAWAPA